MIKAIIFDLDGTLLDTRNDLANSINLVLKEIGKPLLPQDTIISHVGHGIKNLVDACTCPKDEDEEKRNLDLFNRFYSEEYLKTTAPYKGTEELINKLLDLGLKVGVNSNKDDVYTKELIKKHYKYINLEYVLGNIYGMERKPSSQGVETILKKMGIDKQDTIYIGDSKVDIATARNANIDLICVGWGFSKKEDLLKEGNIKLVENPNEILKYIKEKNNA